MIRINVEELRNSMLSKGMFIAIVVGVFLLFQGIWNDLMLSMESGENIYMIKYLSSMHASGIFDILAPVLAVLPAVTTFCEEYQSGYFRYIKIRTSRKEYITNKIFLVGISGGLAVGLPVLIGNSILMSMAEGTAVNKVSYDVNVFAGSIFENIEYVMGGWLVAVSIAGFAFMFGVVWALAGLAAAVCFTNKYMALLLPFTIYFGVFMIFARLNLYQFSPINLICPDMEFIPSVKFVIGYLLFLFIVFGSIAVAGFNRRWRES